MFWSPMWHTKFEKLEENWDFIFKQWCAMVAALKCKSLHVRESLIL